MGRNAKPDSEKARNAGLTAYPQEIAALKAVTKKHRFHAPFDYVRSLMLKNPDPATRGKILPARRAVETQTTKPHPVGVPSIGLPSQSGRV